MKYSSLIVPAMALACVAAPLHADETRLLGINGKVYTLTAAEGDAMEFLYRAMPMSDRLMMEPEYFLRNVRCSLKAREELPWGKNVPDDIWRHFVLPVRSNNEYIDNFRTAYYAELRDRVKNLSMKDAALEVNHWLHEKVTYEPSDARTSAPMSTIKSAKGRCGEESVLGVAAFRAVGIPARQVYTPRWAHTDDNHAWVEVWVDGKWYFLGACEPEPELNRAWFNAPASRGMLMHTRVFGQYPGPEQIIGVRDGITEINVTDNYVPVREAVVTVVDRQGKPVKGVKVEYKIYNYAEFFTAASMDTDVMGRAMLRTGQGNMLAWASDGNYFGFTLIDSPNTRVVLDHKIGEVFSTELDIVPPAENPIPTHATDAQIAENQIRFDRENAMRAAYEESFFGGRFCERNINDLPDFLTDEQRAEADYYLKHARGNWLSIYDFINATTEARMPEALALLGAISEKDLHDTPARVLINTLMMTPPQPDNELYVDYILNPRVANELLSDYRLTLRMPGKEKGLTPEEAIDYITANVKVNNAANAYRVPIIPEKVWKNREADSRSRDIFFVALCRNGGTPARIDPVTGACQYHDGKSWITVDFAKAVKESVPEGIVKASYEPTRYLSDPQYYRHFSISSMKSGSPRQLEFGDDMGESYATILRDGTSLPQGYYLLTTGMRQADGSVKATLSFFNIEANKTTDLPLVMRHSPGSIEVIGAINPEAPYLPAGAPEQQSILSTTGRGYFLIAMLGDTDEPSNHAVTDMESITSLLNDWGRPIVVLGRERRELSGLQNLHYGSDPSGDIRDMLSGAVQTQNTEERATLPLIMVADSFGRVVFFTNGYDTSLAAKLQNLLPAL